MSTGSSRKARFVLATIMAVALLTGTSVIAGKKSGKSPKPQADASVVKVFVHANPPDLLSPWQPSGIEEYSGSGVVIEGNRILTNAHVVEDAISIEVKRNSTSEKFTAEVEYVGHDCDLAILRVPEEKFFEDAPVVPLGDMPKPQDAVQVYGYPIGGETLSVTSGIVSRIELSNYAHSFEDLLMAQIDAPVNEGNSGGPVVADGALVGIASQSLAEGDGVHYMVPVPVIEHFLEDIADGVYHGFPKLGAEMQDLESRAHRQSLGMVEGETGALVSHVDHQSPAHGVLQTGDVLLSIDEIPVANDLSVARPTLGRVNLAEVFQSRQIGERVKVSLLRDGQRITREIELTPHRDLVPGRRPDSGPEYLIFAGLVFQPLTCEYLTLFEEIPPDLMNRALYQNVVTEDRRQLILIQKVLPHPINRGYQDWEDYIVTRVNGVVPRDMEHLSRILGEAEGSWLRIETEDRSFLTIDLEQARQVQNQILKNFGIAEGSSWEPVKAIAGARASL